ncbi:Testican-1 [Manis pentadactyla]|nr:Testican-1 [Manis pentadactyla]
MPAIAVLAAAAAAWCFLQVESRHPDALAGGAGPNHGNFLDNDQWLSTVSQYDRDKYWNRFRDVLPSPRISEPLDSPLCGQVSRASELLQFLLLFGNKTTIGFMDGVLIRGDPILKSPFFLDKESSAGDGRWEDGVAGDTSCLTRNSASGELQPQTKAFLVSPFLRFTLCVHLGWLLWNQFLGDCMTHASTPTHPEREEAFLVQQAVTDTLIQTAFDLGRPLAEMLTAS